MLVLWQFEECPHSRVVRKRLSEMALDYISVNAPPGHAEKDSVMEKLFGNSKAPSLWDTRTGALVQGEDAIGEYLQQQDPAGNTTGRRDTDVEAGEAYSLIEV